MPLGAARLHRHRASVSLSVHDSVARRRAAGRSPRSASTIAAAAHAIVHVFSPGEFSSLFHQVASPDGGDQRKEPGHAAGVDRGRRAHRGRRRERRRPGDLLPS